MLGTLHELKVSQLGTLAYEDFWRISAERMQVFWKRYAGLPEPWTEENILRKFRICVPYRVLNRTTQYVVSEVVGKALDEQDAAFRVLLFQRFNKLHTWERLRQRFGEPRLASYIPSQYALEMDQWTEPIFTGGYRLDGKIGRYNEFFGGLPKHYKYLFMLDYWLNKEDLLGAIGRLRTDANGLLEELCSRPTIGPYIGVQTLTALNYTNAVDYSENEPLVITEGCLRGMRHCFDMPPKRAEQAAAKRILLDMAETQVEDGATYARETYGFPYIRDRRLTVADFQTMFCEFDKWMKLRLLGLGLRERIVKDGRRGGSVRGRHFDGERLPLPEAVFPEKWGLRPLPRDEWHRIRRERHGVL